MIDHFSKCVEAIPVYTKDMNTIVHLVDKYIVKKYGPPKVILTDNGREFKNQVCESFAKERNIIWRFGSPYKPTTTGLIERFNRTLVSKFRKITEFGKYDWAKCVRKAVNAYKQSYHRAIGC
ncbi:Gag-Pol polyprotein, partial [Nosema granulosis]